TTIPQSLEELIIEQAIAREALRLAFEQHKSLAVGLKGVQQERTISDTFEQTQSGETLVRLDQLDLLVGSGGVLSHAPRRAQAAGAGGNGESDAPRREGAGRRRGQGEGAGGHAEGRRGRPDVRRAGPAAVPASGGSRGAHREAEPVERSAEHLSSARRREDLG